MKIRAKNYQAIKDVTIEGEGLIVITGPSNRGKSSLLRAIEMAFFGASGDAFIRDGESATSVGVVDTNLVLKWRKVAASKVSPSLQTALELNGKTYTKLGREHSELTEPLGFKEIRTKDGKIRLRPQIAAQHDSMFLITESEITIAEILKELGRADIVTEAQKRAKADKRDREAKRGVREGDQLRLGTEIKELSWVHSRRDSHSWLRANCLVLRDFEGKVQHVRSLIEGYKQKAERLVPPTPAIADISERLSVLEKVRRFKSLAPTKVPNEVQLIFPKGQVELRAKLEQLILFKSDHEKLMIEVGTVEILVTSDEVAFQELKEKLRVCPLCAEPFKEINA